MTGHFAILQYCFDYGCNDTSLCHINCGEPHLLTRIASKDECAIIQGMVCVHLGTVSVYRVAMGTAHGFGVFDYIQRTQISSKCTLNPSGASVDTYFQL